MTPIVTGAREVLLNKMQCLRDSASAMNAEIDALIARKEACCTSSSSSSSSSGTTANNAQWSDNEYVLFSNNEEVEFT
jgi:hypothetical protein